MIPKSPVLPTKVPAAIRQTLVVTALLLPLCAIASPKWVRVTVPGTQADTGMVVAWNDTAGGAGTVEYGLAGGALNSKADTKSFKGKGNIGHIYELTLTGLAANTKYDYRVKSAGASSKTYHFTTAPADGCSPYSFIAGGDHRSDDDAGPNPKWKPIIEDMKAHSPRFILESGDLVKSGKVEKQWVAHMNMAEALLPWIPMMPAIGNHDADSAKGANAYYNQIFALPTNDISGTEDYWAFTYGNILVLSLSTQTFGDDGFVNQAKWMDKTLTKYKDMTWKVAFYHHPSYTSYADLKIADLNHPPNEKGQNKAFLPVFDKHGVDVVFAGHNHFYERFQPMKGGKPVTSGGTVYVTSGGTGAFTYDVIDIGILKIEPMKIICGEGVFGVGGGIAEGSVKCSGKNHFVYVKVDGNKLEAKVLSTSAQNFGTDPKNKGEIDSFTIIKPGTPTCKQVPPGPDAGSTDAGAADAGGSDSWAGGVDAGSAKDAGSAAAADAGSAADTGSGADTATGADSGAATGADSGAATGADTGADTAVAAADDTKKVDTGGKATPTDGVGTGPGTGGAPSVAAQPAGESSSGCSAASAGHSAGACVLLLLLAACTAWVRRRQTSASIANRA